MKTVIKKWLPANKEKIETIEISDPLELLEKYVTGVEDESGKYLILGSEIDSSMYHILSGKDFTVGLGVNIDDILGLISRKECTIHTFQDYEEAVKWVNKE
ncbi:MAG TPA: hypothetical protein VE868_02055 [Balneolaceae bacterium]|nr:hypothetical protein [Balneolales bacterium]HYW34165.1 hypothetical protein [Balneolaceae bacterium]